MLASQLRRIILLEPWSRRTFSASSRRGSLEPTRKADVSTLRTLLLTPSFQAFQRDLCFPSQESGDNHPTKKTVFDSQSEVAAYSKYENLLSENKELQERIKNSFLR